jgi:hypothetical protein
MVGTTPMVWSDETNWLRKINKFQRMAIHAIQNGGGSGATGYTDTSYLVGTDVTSGTSITFADLAGKQISNVIFIDGTSYNRMQPGQTIPYDDTTGTVDFSNIGAPANGSTIDIFHN